MISQQSRRCNAISLTGNSDHDVYEICMAAKSSDNHMVSPATQFHSLQMYVQCELHLYVHLHHVPLWQ